MIKTGFSELHSAWCRSFQADRQPGESAL